MANFLELVTVVLGGGCLSIKLLAVWSHTRTAAHGIIHGKLAPSSPAPKSICSEGEGATLEPLVAEDGDAWESLQDTIEALSGRFETINESYLHAVFRTPIWGFEEDLEARFDKKGKKIHLRSSSRVGYLDSGSNKKRIDKIKSILES